MPPKIAKLPKILCTTSSVSQSAAYGLTKCVTNRGVTCLAGSAQQYMGQDEFYGEQYGHTQSSSEPKNQQYYPDGNHAHP